MATTDIHRIDHHGSLVRPTELAASGGSAGDLRSREDEDEAIREVTRAQRKLRQTIVTDGHFRRQDFRDVVLAKVSGFEQTEEVDPDGLRVWRNVGTLESPGDLVVSDTVLTREITAIPTKATLPSPAYLAAHVWQVGAPGPYRSAAELGFAIAAIIRDELRDLIAAGVRYVQLDNPDLSSYYAGTAQSGRPAIDVLEAIAIESAAVDGLDRPDDMQVAICVDWGEYPVDEVDEQAAWEIFGGLPYDRFLIPYFGEAFAEQRLLQFVREESLVVLGIMDAAATELEDPDSIIPRIERAFELKNHATLAFSPSRGFQNAAYLPPTAPMARQNRILTHVETIARMVYGGEL